MSALQSARERARHEVTVAILDKAREHLAAQGAAGLSLRAVARDLGVVQSAVYRYFENRDALLTALLVDSYNSLGATVEATVDASAAAPPAQRWVDAATAIHSWAIARPHEYALLYGSPVPGYKAPADTIAPGTRVSFALLRIVHDAHTTGHLRPPALGGVTPNLSPGVEAEMTAAVQAFGSPLDPATMFAVMLAWTQLFGLLSFELFGQTQGVITDSRAVFVAAASAMAAMMGL
jgi:AcrR family transcriptional regulator